MKCKNCGAQYKTREVKCPYCNTENLIGKIWQTERTQAELDYEAEKKKLGKILRSSYMEDRLLTRAILILIGLYIASVLVVALIVVLSGPIEVLIFTIAMFFTFVKTLRLVYGSHVHKTRDSWHCAATPRGGCCGVVACWCTLHRGV